MHSSTARTSAFRIVGNIFFVAVVAAMMPSRVAALEVSRQDVESRRAMLAIEELSLRVTASDDSAAVVAVVTGFHKALAAGDSVEALSLLDSGVVILESGDEEHLAEYRAHHLGADIEFARAVRTTTASIRVTVRGDVAWAISTSVTTGTFRGRSVNSAGAELMVLIRVETGWRIAAIHWSSHARRMP